MVKSKEDKAAYQREWWRNHPEYAADQWAKFHEWIDNLSYSDYIYIQKRKQARKKDIEFNLDKSDITIPNRCPILDIELKQGRTPEIKGPQRNSPSIDRIDNSKGYVKGNIQIVSNRVNTMKNDASPEELLKFADWIYKTYG